MHKHILAVFFLVTNISAQTVTWEQTKGPVGGSIRAITLNGQGDLFALAGGHLFRTRTDQINWLIKSKDINAAMSVIAVDSRDNLFVGTFHQDLERGPTGGIFRSTDNGETWFHIQQGLPDAHINDLQVNSNDEIFAVTPNLILKSIDDGETWQVILDDSTKQLDEFRLLAINSQDHLFVGTFGSGILRSTDGGANWTVINTGQEYRTVYDFAIDADGVIFIGVKNNGAYRSRDNGATWEKINNGLPSSSIVEIEVNSKGDLFAATYGSFYTSRDGGDSWTEVNNSKFIKNTTNILISKQDDIFIGTSGNGVIYSNDNGASWLPINHGLASSYVTAFTINRHDALIAGTIGGLSISENSGDTWQQIENLSSRYISHMAESPNGTILTGSDCPGDNSQFMLRSLDNGYTWREMTHMRRCVLSLFINLNEDIFISTSYFIDGIYRSQDNGDTWEQLHPELVAITLAVNQNNHIFAGTWADFYRSNDEGHTWDLVQTPVQNPRGNHLLINSENHIFAELRRFPSSELFRSTDDGLTWDILALGLDDTTGLRRHGFSINALYQDIGNNLWAGTSEGVYFSPDNGETWQLENFGLEESTVCSFDMNSKGMLFAGTCGDGIFRTSESVVSIKSAKVDRPNDFILEQNYPNPFNPSTTILYELPSRTHVILKIFNLVGQEVATLVDEVKSVGRYEVRLDAGGFASGIYFYRLQAGEFVETKKLLLLK